MTIFVVLYARLDFPSHQAYLATKQYWRNFEAALAFCKQSALDDCDVFGRQSTGGVWGMSWDRHDGSFVLNDKGVPESIYFVKSLEEE